MIIYIIYLTIIFSLMLMEKLITSTIKNRKGNNVEEVNNSYNNQMIPKKKQNFDILLN
ncbi:hypothetical protein [Clostridium cibarium]|uniref:Uncharacterized protein n=1 Tax=Clostridium cibarium TaxID=2762247 RepID=A0ABR8PYR8_9CLOT|nr:hypothetical protein [Clostridium cibarium]MBD7913309.1 hypothetical protein [Clostridium cibarium]